MTDPYAETDPSKFQVGATYVYGHPVDHTWKTVVTVIRRTAKFITIEDSDGQQRRVGVKTDQAGEWVFPEGSYSMCAVLRASHVVEQSR